MRRGTWLESRADHWLFSKHLDYAGVVPLVGENFSLQRVIIKWYTGVEEPNGHYLKLE